jgi:hypothetical protein
MANARCTVRVQRTTPGRACAGCGQPVRLAGAAIPCSACGAKRAGRAIVSITAVAAGSRCRSHPAPPRHRRYHGPGTKLGHLGHPLPFTLDPVLVVHGLTSPAPRYPVTPVRSRGQYLRARYRPGRAGRITHAGREAVLPLARPRRTVRVRADRYGSGPTHMAASVHDVDDRNDGPDQRDEDHLGGAHRVGSRHQRCPE